MWKIFFGWLHTDSEEFIVYLSTDVVILAPECEARLSEVRGIWIFLAKRIVRKRCVIVPRAVVELVDAPEICRHDRRRWRHCFWIQSILIWIYQQAAKFDQKRISYYLNCQSVNHDYCRLLERKIWTFSEMLSGVGVRPFIINKIQSLYCN